MVSLRKLLVCVAFALLIPAHTVAAQEKGAIRGKDRPRDGLIARITHLMPDAIAVELNLTTEQRKTIQELDNQFRAERREILLKTATQVMGIIESLQHEEKAEVAPVLAICHEITGGLLEARRSRNAFEQKVLAALNEDQKATFAELKMHPPWREWHGDNTAHFISRRIENRLNLTVEQKRKASELCDEFQQKFRAVLTDEQRRQFDHLIGSRRGDARSVEKEDKKMPQDD